MAMAIHNYVNIVCVPMIVIFPQKFNYIDLECSLKSEKSVYVSACMLTCDLQLHEKSILCVHTYSTWQKY